MVSHYNIAPVIDIYGSVSGRDLGGVARDINTLIDAPRWQLPRGSQVVVRGQVQTMRSSYIGLLGGLVFAILLDYLLIVVNFQSWLDPFIMISALPAALAGIAWFLFITHTTLSVPALMGTIMCMGVATCKQHSGGELRHGTDGGGKRCRLSGAGGGVYAFPPGADDRPGHDYRHGSDGAGIGRRRGTKCSAGARRNRRSAFRHGIHTALRSYILQRAARIARVVQ